LKIAILTIHKNIHENRFLHLEVMAANRSNKEVTYRGEKGISVEADRQREAGTPPLEKPSFVLGW